MSSHRNDWLKELAEIEEHRFHSDVAVLGPIISRFREAWNSVATKWYVRSLVQQQNDFNRLVADRLREQDERLIEQDREQAELVHDLAALTAQITQANRLLSSIEERLERLERQLQNRQQAE